ncbi:MAG: methylated-DNA--[protein]-cysteine S-methyltransferase [Balneolaceae bacterium]|nr:methylated-DNA--[protein]-cysteine S-methyltransferase [Balneolaceae bacterium]
MNDLPRKEEMYRAFINRDSSYDGIFITGVKTTGIFCRPVCPAKKPKAENLEFFPDSRAALNAGYRPCKRCKPLHNSRETPVWLQKILTEVEKEPTQRWTNTDISELGTHPNRLRRWFKKHHGITFQEYLRLRRLGSALGQIKHGETTAQTAFDHDYESLSGFREAMKNWIGKPVQEGCDTKVLHLNRITTPLGPMLAGATDTGLCLLEFTDRRMLEKQLKILSDQLNSVFIPGSNIIIEQTADELNSYFEGTIKNFRVPLLLHGTDFQKTAWNQLRTIPYGQTRSYQEQAMAIGNKQAVRAVARTNGENRIAIIIPCHRVIGKNGKLTGYSGGLWRKKFLLSLERNHADPGHDQASTQSDLFWNVQSEKVDR